MWTFDIIPQQSTSVYCCHIDSQYRARRTAFTISNNAACNLWSYNAKVLFEKVHHRKIRPGITWTSKILTPDYKFYVLTLKGADIAMSE